MKVISIIFCLCLVTLIPKASAAKWWLWICDTDGGLCKRISKTNSIPYETTFPTLELCRLVCGQYGALWPQPTLSSKIGSNLKRFAASQLSVTLNARNEALEYLNETEKYLNKIITRLDSETCPNQNKVNVEITVRTNGTSLDWTTDESFSLQIDNPNNAGTINVKIVAETVFGARHGVETLTQLMEFYPDENYEGKTCLAIVTEADIRDQPAYPHRGLLIDTARNFQSISTLKKHLDAMAASKLNVLHWHITDSQSFPLELPKLPNMAIFGAYSEDKIYTPDNVSEIEMYAKYKGIRVLLEFDAPSHAGNGWQWGPDAGLGHLSVCINQAPFRNYCIQPPCGQLNPINDNVYKILESLYADMIAMAPKSGFFHMGGDEVYLPCWNQTAEIVSYLNGNTTTEAFLELWSVFQEKASQAFFRAAGNTNVPLILWTSHLTDAKIIEKYLSKDKYVIQTWVPKSDSLTTDLIKLGYRVIVSTKDAWYLDHGFWGATDYHDWKVVYDNKIPKGPKALGGEVCMWGELVDDFCVESRTWPRAAAAAERLWADPDSSADSAVSRFLRHRERLVSRGINAEALAPQWCYQNEGEC